MPQVRKAPAPDVPATVKTVTRTVEQVQLPPVEQDQPLKPDISEFFASLTPADRKMYSFYLTRLDPNIEVTDPRVNNPNWKGGKYLYRFTDEDLKDFEGKEFWSTLQEWTKRRFGGSKYQMMITNHKISKAEYCKPFEVEGEPVLSNREGYRA